MKHSNKNLLTLSIVLASVASLHVNAGGLWLNEYGTPAMGRANAGSQAGEDNASASLSNPASMSRLDQDQVMVTGGFIYSEVQFSVDRSSLAAGNHDSGDAGSTAPFSSAFYTHKIDDQWSFGLSVAALAGAELDYDSGWTGRYQADYVSLLGLAVMPAVSYKVNDWISIGVGVPIMYTELEMDLSVPNLEAPATGDDGSAKLDGDDIVVGFNLSTLLELNDDTRLGFVYQSEMAPEYGGDVSFDLAVGSNTVGVDTELTLAARFYGGLMHQINPDIKVYASLGWEDWSSMDNVVLSSSGGGAALNRNWNDTYHYATGVDYVLNNSWVLQAGISYDTNPVDTKDRTADMPVDRQIRYAFGAQYKNPQSKGPSIGAQIIFADVGSAGIDTDGLGVGPGLGIADGFAGEYKDNNLIFFSVNVNWILGE